MLLHEFACAFDKRSTGRISAKKMAPVIGILKTSRTLYGYDQGRRRNGHTVKFSAVQMMTLLFFIEIRKLGCDEYLDLVHGRGSQVLLRNLGMPQDGNGRYIAPSAGWVSEFRNREWPKFRKALEAETREAVLGLSEDRLFTIDSTPVEASRYSKWADFNVHYRIRMAK